LISKNHNLSSLPSGSLKENLNKIQKQVSRGSTGGIATDYRLDDRMIGVRFLARAGNLSLHHRVQTGSGAHPPSYPMDIGGVEGGVKENPERVK
jgi:hypothetical protein